MTMTRRMTALARPTTGLARPTTGLARIGRRIADVLAECDYAQRRWLTVMTTPDSFPTSSGDQAPDDYAEFLFRSSGSLRHEPVADRAQRCPAA
jgi:hypothetical protein